VARPIAEVQQKAESGDYVVVEGTVKDYFMGNGSNMVVILEDASGSLPLVVPNSMLRRFAGGTASGGSGPTGAEPTIGNRARVGGRWDHKPMDYDTWGIYVSRAEPLGKPSNSRSSELPTTDPGDPAPPANQQINKPTRYTSELGYGLLAHEISSALRPPMQ